LVGATLARRDDVSNELLIASHARCLGMTQVTRRTRELKNAPGMVAESWMK